MVRVKYIADNTIDTEDFYLCLNNANRQYDNSSITFKVMLYLVSLLTDNGLNDNTCIISTDDIQRKLSISNINSFKGSLDYISSLTFNYKLDKINKWQYVDNIFVSYTQFKGYFKVIFSDEFITLLDRSKQFYQIPKSLLNSDIRYYRNSVFMANYILLHQRRNMRQDKEKYRHTISVAKLLDNSPFIPKYEELDTRQRQVSKCIIKPFENNLNFACSLLGKVWHYIDEEPTNYIEFVKAKIYVS